MIKIIEHNYKVDLTPFESKLEAIARDLKIRGDIVIKLGGRPESQNLNAKFRKKKYPTDVLSFYYGDKLPDGFYLGDIFICYPIAVEQAEENEITVQNELFRLIIHGILHLVGHDHEEEASNMLELQEQILKKYDFS